MTNLSTFNLLQGDCLEVLKTLEDNSVDSIVTDPPYGLSAHKQEEVIACLTAWLSGQDHAPKGAGFMGKEWDAWVPSPSVWRECMRVLKPGGHVLAFAGTRSMDLMCMAIRLAGFELRDSIGYAHNGMQAPLMAWVTGQGFPKGLDVSKAIDKELDATRKDAICGGHRGISSGDEQTQECRDVKSIVGHGINCGQISRGTPVTKEAMQWSGFNTALKPAWEPIIMARKPLQGTIAANVLQYGTGGVNIDACRIGLSKGDDARLGGNGSWATDKAAQNVFAGGFAGDRVGSSPLGRWPANLIHDGSDEVLQAFPDAIGQQGDLTYHSKKRVSPTGCFGDRPPAHDCLARNDETKSAARFFYCAKACKSDREEGLEQFNANTNTNTRANIHPTVKPTKLMQYLCRLVTPPGGVVLDMYMGSGSTGKAALLEGFNFVGIEQSGEFFEIAQARILHAQNIRTKQVKSLHITS